MFAVTLDDHLYSSSFPGIDQDVCEPRLYRRVQVNLGLLKQHGRSFGNKETEHENGQYLRHAKPDVSQKHVRRPGCAPDSHLIQLTAISNGYDAKVVNEP